MTEERARYDDGRIADLTEAAADIDSDSGEAIGGCEEPTDIEGQAKAFLRAMGEQPGDDPVGQADQVAAEAIAADDGSGEF